MRKLLILLLFILSFILVLPPIVKFGAVHYLEKQNLQANIDAVSINLFSAKVGIEGLHYYGGEQSLHLGHASVDLSWLALFNQRLLIEQVKVTGLDTSITQSAEGWNIGGLQIPIAENSEIEEPAQEPGSEWGFGLEQIMFANLNANINTFNFLGTAGIKQLELHELYSWKVRSPTSYSLAATIDDAPIQISGSVYPFSDPLIVEAKIDIDAVPFKPFSPTLEKHLKKAEGLLNAGFQLNVESGERQTSIILHGDYGLSDLDLLLGEQGFKSERAIWSGQQKFYFSDSGSEFDISGNLKANKFVWQDLDKKLEAIEESIEFNGDVNISITEEKTLVVGLATLGLGSFSLAAVKENIELLRFNSLQLAGVSIEDGRYKVTEGVLLDSALLHDKNGSDQEPLLNANRILLSGVDLTDSLLTLDTVELDKISSKLILNDQKEIDTIETTKRIFSSPEQKFEEAKKIEEEDVETKGKFLVGVKRIVVNDADLEFFDNSVSPLFQSKLHNINLLVENVDQQKPESNIELLLNAKVGEYGKIKMEGVLQPFTAEQNGELDVVVSNMELVPLSPYTSQSAGLNIKRGILNADAKVKIEKNQLNVDNNFYLLQLNLEDAGVEAESDFLASLPMPLDLTLDVLRDKENTIHLKIPVEGSINDPKFELQDIYNKAIAKALKFTATYYLTQAVQPLGLIFTASELIAKGMAPSFEPLIYNPAVNALSEDNKQHLKNIAKLLNEREKLRITLCAVSAESDWQAMTEEDKEKYAKQKNDKNLKINALLGLADRRAAEAKSFFVQQYKLDPARIFVCNSKIHKETNGVPELRVSL